MFVKLFNIENCTGLVFANLRFQFFNLGGGLVNFKNSPYWSSNQDTEMCTYLAEWSIFMDIAEF